VFSHAENVQPHLVSEFDLFHEVSQPGAYVELAAGLGIEAGFREGVDADFHGEKLETSGIHAKGIRSRRESQTLQGMSAIMVIRSVAPHRFAVYDSGSPE
jgi:hypothetical protein